MSTSSPVLATRSTMMRYVIDTVLVNSIAFAICPQMRTSSLS